MAISADQLFAAFDQVQHRLAQIEVTQDADRQRVDKLVADMNGFVLEIRNNLTVLLDAKITEPKESSNGN